MLLCGEEARGDRSQGYCGQYRAARKCENERYWRARASASSNKLEASAWCEAGLAAWRNGIMKLKTCRHLGARLIS
jgi:hypothetical protein